MAALDEYPWRHWINNLAGLSDFLEPLPEPERTEKVEETYELLKGWTGQDFGYDVNAWQSWMEERPYWEIEPEYNERLDHMILQRQGKQTIPSVETSSCVPPKTI